MAEKTLKDIFTEAMLAALDETFENVHGMYLDRGTSLFETLATITAEEASRPVSANCASLAAQVAHVCFYLEVTMRFVRGERPRVDWTEIWRTVRAVTPEEWAASQQRLRETYGQIRALVTSMDTWEGEGEVGGALALLMHNAYHLGEIRQALCTIKPDR
ncbi:MAG: DinB family protein [Chloroflexi bacterium]|nr:DinB family protein [Chloroflexota bacterium]